MLRNRIPRQGRHAPPLSVVRGITIDTFIGTEIYDRSGRIQSRSYVTEVELGRDLHVIELELSREDDDRRAWEQHWLVRNILRSKRLRRQ